MATSQSWLGLVGVEAWWIEASPLKGFCLCSYPWTGQTMTLRSPKHSGYFYNTWWVEKNQYRSPSYPTFLFVKGLITNTWGLWKRSPYQLLGQVIWGRRSLRSSGRVSTKQASTGKKILFSFQKKRFQILFVMTGNDSETVKQGSFHWELRVGMWSPSSNSCLSLSRSSLNGDGNLLPLSHCRVSARRKHDPNIL